MECYPSQVASGNHIAASSSSKIALLPELSSDMYPVAVLATTLFRHMHTILKLSWKNTGVTTHRCIATFQQSVRADRTSWQNDPRTLVNVINPIAHAQTPCSWSFDVNLHLTSVWTYLERSPFVINSYCNRDGHSVWACLTIFLCSWLVKRREPKGGGGDGIWRRDE